MRALAALLLLGSAPVAVTPRRPPVLKARPVLHPVRRCRGIADPVVLAGRRRHAADRAVAGDGNGAPPARTRPLPGRSRLPRRHHVAGEGTLDLPEQRGWKKPDRDDARLTRCERKHYDERIGRKTDADYWNNRARGMAGLLTSAGAEDLLGDPYSRYHGETIFVHEFSHILLHAIRAVDPALFARVEAAYAAALRDDRWKDEYASTTIDEYWAEGTQFWFNSNRLASFDGVQILSHRDLKRYDPALYAVLRQAYGGRHRLDGDPNYNSAARVPPGPIPKNTAEVC